ncbi:MAG: hypothetical protein IJU13_09120 [Bacteroidales bacterium]|nr:hypothetical protein [Bacteroidales bacterium]
MEKRSNIIVLVLYLMTLFGAIVFALDNINLRNRINERDQYLESFVLGDTTIIRERAVKEPVFVLGDKEMRAEEFVQFVNELRLGYLNTLDSLDFYRHYYRLVQKEFDFHYSVEPAEDSTMLKYSISYPRDANDLQKMSQSQFLLDAVIKKYDISIEEGDGYYVITSPKLDSALAIFPYFRDRIHKTSDGAWVISVD